MDAQTVLDFAVFQLSPTRTRCDVYASAGMRTEKLTSGMLNAFLCHSQTLKEQFDNGSGSIRLQPLNILDSHPSSWFTKGTLQRFVRFVRNPEILERVATIEMELMQLEETFRMQTRSSSVSEKKTVCTALLTSDSSIGARKSTATCYENSKQMYSHRHGIYTTGNSRILLLQALEARRKILQKEQEVAFACALTAGFNNSRITDLIAFAETFRASRLRDACLKFIRSFDKRQNTPILCAEDTKQDFQQKLKRYETRMKSVVTLECQHLKSDLNSSDTNKIEKAASHSPTAETKDTVIVNSIAASGPLVVYSPETENHVKEAKTRERVSRDPLCKKDEMEKTRTSVMMQNKKRDGEQLSFWDNNNKNAGKSCRKTLKPLNGNSCQKYSSQQKVSRQWNLIYQCDPNDDGPSDLIMVENELFEEERDDRSSNASQMSVRDFVSIFEGKSRQKRENTHSLSSGRIVSEEKKESNSDKDGSQRPKHGTCFVSPNATIMEPGGENLEIKQANVSTSNPVNEGTLSGANLQKPPLLDNAVRSSEDRVKRFLDRYHEKRVAKLKSRSNHVKHAEIKENNLPGESKAISVNNNIQAGNLRRNPIVLQETRKNEMVEELTVKSSIQNKKPSSTFQNSTIPHKVSTIATSKQGNQLASSTRFSNEKTIRRNPTEVFSNIGSHSTTHDTEVTVETDSSQVRGKSSTVKPRRKGPSSGDSAKGSSAVSNFSSRQDPKNFLKKGSGIRSKVGAVVLCRPDACDKEFGKNESDLHTPDDPEIDNRDPRTITLAPTFSAANKEIVEDVAIGKSEDSESESDPFLVRKEENVSVSEVENISVPQQPVSIIEPEDSSPLQPVLNSFGYIHEAFADNVVSNARTPFLQSKQAVNVTDDSFVTPICSDAKEASMTGSSHERSIGTGESDVSRNEFQHFEQKWGTSRHISFIDSNTPNSHGRDLKWFLKFGSKSNSSNGYDRVSSSASDMLEDRDIFGETDATIVNCYGRRRHSIVNDTHSCMASPVDLVGRCKKERGAFKVLSLQRSASTREIDKKNADRHHSKTSAVKAARSFFSLAVPFRRKLQKENR